MSLTTTSKFLKSLHPLKSSSRKRISSNIVRWEHRIASSNGDEILMQQISSLLSDNPGVITERHGLEWLTASLSLTTDCFSSGVILYRETVNPPVYLNAVFLPGLPFIRTQANYGFNQTRGPVHFFFQEKKNNNSKLFTWVARYIGLWF